MPSEKTTYTCSECFKNYMSFDESWKMWTERQKRKGKKYYRQYQKKWKNSNMYEYYIYKSW